MTQQEKREPQLGARALCEAVFLLLLFLSLLVYAVLGHLRLPGNVSFALSPYLFPGVIGACGVFFAARLLPRKVRGEERAGAPGRPLLPLLLLLLFTGMTLAMPRLGFLPAAVLCLLLTLPLLGERRIYAVLLFSLLLPAALYLLFDVVFGVMLP